MSNNKIDSPGKKRILLIVGPILIGVLALLIIFVGASFTNKEQPDGQDKISQDATIEIAGISSVGSLIDSESSFETALSGYFESMGLNVTQASVTLDPQGAPDRFYVSGAEKLLLVQVREGSAARYAFSVCSEPVPGITAPLEETTKTAESESAQMPKEDKTVSKEEPETKEEEPTQEKKEEKKLPIKVSDTEKLASYFSKEDAALLPQIITEYLDNKGIKANGADALIDTNTISKTEEAVNFQIMIDGYTIAAEYSNESFGLALL